MSEAMIRMRSGHRAVDIASWKGKAYPMPPHLRKEDGLTEGASSPVPQWKHRWRVEGGA